MWCATMSRRRWSRTSRRGCRIATAPGSGSVTSAWWRCCRCRARTSGMAAAASAWSGLLPGKTAAMALGEDGAALAARVEAMTERRLGDLRMITPAAGFPLRTVRCRQVIKPAFVLIGDAAHAVHPMAGQGMNLGFADVQGLLKHVAVRNAGSAFTPAPVGSAATPFRFRCRRGRGGFQWCRLVRPAPLRAIASGAGGDDATGTGRAAPRLREAAGAAGRPARHRLVGRGKVGMAAAPDDRSCSKLRATACRPVSGRLQHSIRINECSAPADKVEAGRRNR